MNTKALVSLALLGCSAALFVACGDGDGTNVVVCNDRESSCLNDHVGQVCSADGTAWVSFSCNEGEKCGKSEGENGVFGCQGACMPGETQCGSEVISRVCSKDGRTWLQVTCTPGTGCDGDEMSRTYGTCVRVEGDEPSVGVCDADEVTCADAITVKSCERDRSGWRYTACAANEVCEDADDGAACVVDPAKGCVPHSGSCVDLTHVRRCNGAGQAYEEVEECPNDTTCFDGGCQGPVCMVGAVRCADVTLGNGDIVGAFANGSLDPKTRYRCNEDGTGWELENCSGNAICIYENLSQAAVNAFVEDARAASAAGLPSPSFTVPSGSRATCEVPECAVPFVLRELYSGSARLGGGSFTCGDPTSDELAFLKSYSLCEGLAPYVLPHWANYECPENTQCTYTSSTSTDDSEVPVVVPTCAQECHPGAIACYSDASNLGDDTSRENPTSSISDRGESTITCGDQGTWDTSSIEPCVAGSEGPGQKERELWCGPSLEGGASYDLGRCMEPACSYWFDVYGTFNLPGDTGVCAADGSFRRCKPNGRLDEPEPCASCSPISDARDETYAGFVPGQCDECEPGEQYCVRSVDEGGNGSPFYMLCSHGHFELQSCDGGAFCRDYENLEDPADKDYGQRRILCGGECAPFTASCVDEDGSPGGTLIQVCDEHGVLNAPEECRVGACHDDELGAADAGKASCEPECIDGTKSCADATTEVVCANGRFRANAEQKRTCGGDDFCVTGAGCVECVPNSVTCKSATEIQGCNDDGELEAAIDCPGPAPACISASPSAYCLAPNSAGAGGAAGSGGGAGSGGSGGSGGTAGQGGGAGDTSQGGSAGNAGQGGSAGVSAGAAGDVTSAGDLNAR